MDLPSISGLHAFETRYRKPLLRSGGASRPARPRFGTKLPCGSCNSKRFGNSEPSRGRRGADTALRGTVCGGALAPRLITLLPAYSRSCASLPSRAADSLRPFAYPLVSLLSTGGAVASLDSKIQEWRFPELSLRHFLECGELAPAQSRVSRSGTENQSKLAFSTLGGNQGSPGAS